MEKDNITGLYKTPDGLYRISDTSDGGLRCEEWKPGVGFVPGGNIAEVHWEGREVSEADAETLMRQVLEYLEKKPVQKPFFLTGKSLLRIRDWISDRIEEVWMIGLFLGGIAVIAWESGLSFGPSWLWMGLRILGIVFLVPLLLALLFFCAMFLLSPFLVLFSHKLSDSEKVSEMKSILMGFLLLALVLLSYWIFGEPSP